jgi:hypothetical protein
VAPRPTWGAGPDGAAVGASYNDGMTTITAESTTHQPVRRLTRRTITSFVAGAVLAGGVAVGVTVVTDGGATAPHAHAAAATSEPACLVRQGPC